MKIIVNRDNFDKIVIPKRENKSRAVLKLFKKHEKDFDRVKAIRQQTAKEIFAEIEKIASIDEADFFEISMLYKHWQELKKKFLGDKE